uniref:DNA-directed DNA polymerase n=1 Tax=Vesanto virus TaxID=1955786 RepID=A0A7D5A551_9VIRU|nr:putative DNA polymerase B [Vesanto virus]
MEQTTKQYTFIYAFGAEDGEKIRSLLIELGQKMSWCSVQLQMGVMCVNSKEKEQEIVQYVGPIQHLSNKHNSEICDYWIDKETAQLESLQGSGWVYKEATFKKLIVSVYQHEIFMVPRGYKERWCREVTKEILLQSNFISITKELSTVRWRKKLIINALNKCREQENWQRKLFAYYVTNKRKYDESGKNKLSEHEELLAWMQKHREESNILTKFAKSNQICFIQCLEMPYARPLNKIGDDRNKQFFYVIDQHGEYKLYQPKKQQTETLVNYCSRCDSLHITKHKCPREKELKLSNLAFANNYNKIDLMQRNKLTPADFQQPDFVGFCSFDCETRKDENGYEKLSCICATAKDWRNDEFKWITSRTLSTFLTQMLDLYSGEEIDCNIKCEVASCKTSAQISWHDFDSDEPFKVCREHYKGTFQRIQVFAHNFAGFDAHIILRHWNECEGWLLTNQKCRNSMRFEELEFRHEEHLNIVFCFRDSTKYVSMSLDKFEKAMRVRDTFEQNKQLNRYSLPLRKIAFPMYGEHAEAIEAGTFSFENHFGDQLSQLIDCAYFADVMQGGVERGQQCFRSYWNVALSKKQQYDLLEMVYCGSDSFILLFALAQLSEEFRRFTSIDVPARREMERQYFDTKERRFIAKPIEVAEGLYPGINLLRYYSMPAAALGFVKMFNLLHDAGDLRGFQNCPSVDMYRDVMGALRGGLATPFHRYAHYSQGPILPTDVNGLYSFCMLQPMPNVFVGEFQLTDLEDLPAELRDEKRFCYELCYDVAYPEELTSDRVHLAFPAIFHHLELGDSKKLVASMLPQTNYRSSNALHDFYAKVGLRTTIHSVKVYTAERCLSEAIKYLNEQQMLAVSVRDKARAQIFKFIKNSLYGKMCENASKQCTYKLNTNSSTTRSDQFKLANSFSAPPCKSNFSCKYYSDRSQFNATPSNNSFLGSTNFSLPFNSFISNSQMVRFEQHTKVELLHSLAAPKKISANNVRGMFILDYAKIHLLGFAHKLLRAFPNIRLLYTDTDSLKIQKYIPRQEDELTEFFPRWEQAQFIRELRRHFPDLVDMPIEEDIPGQFCNLIQGEDIEPAQFRILPPSKQVGLFSLELELNEIIKEFLALVAKSHATLSSHCTQVHQKGLPNSALVDGERVNFNHYLTAYASEEPTICTIPTYFKKTHFGLSIGAVNKNTITLPTHNKFKYTNKFYNERYEPYK